MRKINCIYNDNHAWCTNKNIKRSIFGIGARCCKVYPYGEESNCEYFQPRSCLRPLQPPPSVGNRKNVEELI
jgi:hypothetical protein